MKKLLFLGLLLGGAINASDSDSDSGFRRATFEEQMKARRLINKILAKRDAAAANKKRAAVVQSSDDEEFFDAFDTVGEQQEAMPAAATAFAKPTPPQVKPKPKSRTCTLCHMRPCACKANASAAVSAAAAPAQPSSSRSGLPNVRIGGEVHRRWKSGDATQAERDTLAAIGKQTAQDIDAAQRPDTTGDAELAAQLQEQMNRKLQKEDEEFAAKLVLEDEENHNQEKVDEFTAFSLQVAENVKNEQLSQKLAMKTNLEGEILNLQGILNFSDLTEGQIQNLNQQIQDLNQQIQSLDVEIQRLSYSLRY